MRSIGWVAILGSACAADPAIYVGDVDGTDAVLGVVTSGDQGRMYVCGGPDSMATLNGWIELAVDGDAWSGEGAGLSVEATGGAGTLSSASEAGSWSFTLAAGADPDGPWAAEETVGECPVGVVVLDGGQRVQGVACPQPLAPAQVVPVGLVKPGSEELRVTAGDLAFAVVPAAP